MSAEQSAPIDYATAPPPAPRPGFWLSVAFGLGWLLTVLGGLGVVINCALFVARWYLGLPVPTAERNYYLMVLAGSVAYLVAGVWLLRRRYRRRGAP